MWWAWLIACGGDPARPEALAPSSFDALPPASSWVSLRGQAHFGATVTQRQPASLIANEVVHYVFPLVPEHSTETRGVSVFVRTTREPEARVSYETFTVEGLVRPFGDDLLDPATQAALLERSGYYAKDGAIWIDARRIEAVDGTYVEPD